MPLTRPLQAPQSLLCTQLFNCVSTIFSLTLSLSAMVFFQLLCTCCLLYLEFPSCFHLVNLLLVKSIICPHSNQFFSLKAFVMVVIIVILIIELIFLPPPHGTISMKVRTTSVLHILLPFVASIVPANSKCSKNVY